MLKLFGKGFSIGTSIIISKRDVHVSVPFCLLVPILCFLLNGLYRYLENMIGVMCTSFPEMTFAINTPCARLPGIA